MPLRLYNTLSRTKEVFTPLTPGEVSMYTCGPTVYRYVHIGNLRTFLMADLLRRVLEYEGLRVRQVKNITDVGHLTDETFDRGQDKMLVSARLEKKSPQEIARFYTEAFQADERRLNIQPAHEYPKASDHIPQMVEIIEHLIKKGHAYEVEGTVFYDIASFPAYGQLSGNTQEKLLAGTRGQVDPHKRGPLDFTLWKAAGERRLVSWPSPWGPGFPGWHIECSAMSLAHLGPRFDIHTGGADNVFPHHEAEIAQSEGALGHRVVSCWVHGQHLLLSGVRMAKSAGNFFRITELEEEGIDPLAFRYLALQTRYRAPMNFSPEGLSGANRALLQLRQRMADWSEGPDGDRGTFAQRFRAAVEDDLDLPQAMALVSELVRSDLPGGAKVALLTDFDRVLGLDLARDIQAEVALPSGAADLLEARRRAREVRDFATADQLRQSLADLGVQVVDSPDGQRWKLLIRT